MMKRLVVTLCIAVSVLMIWGAGFAQSPKRVVLIDPGHGGADPGVKVGEKSAEKDVTLAIALLTKKALAGGGVEVLLTRTTDATLSTADRTRAAATARPDLVLSLHVNAGFDKKASGFEVWFPGFQPASSNGGDSKAILKDMAKNQYLNESVRLARAIEKNLSAVFPKADRGLREAPIPILEGLAVPAVVVEIGFATNPAEGRKLLDGGTQQAVAAALAKSIREVL
jgi:N-acetylmuramoyl-L-alanine amidase